MKKLFILFLAVGLFTSCNNKKESAADKDSTTTTKDKDEKDKDKDDNKDTKEADDDVKSTGWARSDESKFLDECETSATPNVGAARAKDYCNCMLLKLEKMYSSYNEANTALTGISQTELNELAADCNR
jgi:hypothetical protein